MNYLVWFGLEVTKISCRDHHCNVLVLGFSKGIICRGLFEFSLSLPLDLRISTNPLKVSQIIEGGTSWVGRKYCQKFGRFKMITSLTFFR